MLNFSRINIYLVLMSAMLIVGCSSTDYRKKSSAILNTTAFYKAQDSEYEDFYKKGFLGKVTIWTNKDFINSSNLSPIEIFNNRKLSISYDGIPSGAYIGTIGENSKYTIYVPTGSVTLITNNGTNKLKATNLQVVGGKEVGYFWKTPEATLVSQEIDSISFNFDEVISWTSINQLKNILSPKIFIENKSDNESSAILKISYSQKLSKLTVNSEDVTVSEENYVTVKMPVNFGSNTFKIYAENINGFSSVTTHIITRKTDAEKRQEAMEELAIKRRLAESARLESIRIANEAKARKAEAERIAREGDGSNEDKLCQRYGLKPQTNGYAECRMRLDFAKAESIKQQQQYEREQAAYQEQMAAIQKERERQRAMKQLELGLRMMGGQSPVDAVNSVGTGAPIAPRAPTPTNQTITLPNGRMINCSTFGTMTNCF